ncbi:MAG: DUF3147 family protein [Verrucomicrobiales bacterium]|nr:DUF3147 family protein [Verrucomicrobiales bacterium]
MPVLLKLLLSAGLIYFVNEVVIRHSRPLLGSLLASLPLVSLITFVWIYYGLQADPAARVQKLASHSEGVFWFVLPSLPMFLVFPWLIRRGMPFWGTMAVCVFVTMILYYLMTLVLKRFGMSL